MFRVATLQETTTFLGELTYIEMKDFVDIPGSRNSRRSLLGSASFKSDAPLRAEPVEAHLHSISCHDLNRPQ